jgi:cation diffusion facilitator CzcD-associated flavoprotein CzcO
MSERVFAVIIGSGFGGLGAAIALRKAGISDFVVLEKADAVGGTWRENTYPGCACDVPSHLYSYSFERNPRWSETYSPQAEIRAYLEHCADKYDVRRHVRFGAEAVSAELDEASGSWTVETRARQRFTARVVIGAVGPLHRFSLPKIPGLDRFRGKVIHSARWDPSFDPRGQRVAVVGAGASAIQLIPAIVDDVAEMVCFQRTPAWVLPREERRYTELEKRLFARVPAASWLVRQEIFLRHELRTLGFVKEPRILAFAERMALKHMAGAISDPKLRATLTPSYRMGCKRILMSNTYYPALSRPHVEVFGSALAEVTEQGVLGPDGVEREVDAILLGTGFDVHDYLGPMRVRGRGGRDLGEQWARDGAHAYLGVTAPGFPNFYTLVGPNTGLGSNSILFMIEAQVAMVMKLVGLVRDEPGALVEVREDVERAFNARIQEELRSTIWETGCQSWYHDDAGRNSTLWPGLCTRYLWETRRFRPADYAVTEGRSPAA